jgi:replicative DNA helicase
MITDAAADTFADPLTTLKTLHAATYAVTEAVIPRNLRTNMATTIEEDKSDYEREEVFPQGLGVTYGLDLLDLHTGGLIPGELAVIGARAKTGKTMLGLHAMAAAVRQGHRPLVFTLEMSLKEIRTRLAALFSGVSYDRLSHRHLSEEEKQKLWEAREELRELGGIQIECPEEGDRTVESLLGRARQYGTDYLFIDQLSEMEAGVTVRSLKEHHVAIMEALTTEISRPGKEIPTILAAQLRRNDEVITLESFSNATEVEAYADILFGLWRSRDMRNQSMMAFDILGSRRSDVANYLLNWELSSRTDIRILEERRE